MREGLVLFDRVGYTLQDILFTINEFNIFQLAECFFLLMRYQQETLRIKFTLRAESFAGRNFRDFRDFDPFSRKLMPGKKLNEKFAKVIFAKNKLFQKSRKFFQSLKN